MVQDFVPFAGALFTLFVLMYSLLFIINGPKSANKFAKFIAKKILRAVRWIFVTCWSIFWSATWGPVKRLVVDPSKKRKKRKK